MSFPTVPQEQLEALRTLLAKPKRIVIVSHFNPDGDAIGSSLGLMHVLRAVGHTVKVVLPNTPATFLDGLPGRTEILCFDRSPDASLSTIRTCDILFCLDFNKLDRIGGLEEAAKVVTNKVLIDHHQEPDVFTPVMFSDTASSSTCQMVYDIVVALGHGALIDRDAATCLYTGMVTDSGSFRYRSTTPHTMRVAADLMERGVDIDKVHGSISDTNTVERLKLMGFMLSQRMEVLASMRTTVIALSMNELKEHNYKPGDTEGFVNYGLSIQGVRLSAFFVERPELVKVSLRSKGDLPVDQFLKEHFNGGGHANAAGGHTKEPLDVAVQRFIGLLPAFLNAHPA
ncbi:MAG: bifunctional oligoribonuclease/PAP phosphatase NrnA [Flavobacteriales bacterium]|nr:bifunctional oligoribonuclease/PAP phosphatase NrnA [Flavobacteriales bacterium]